MHSNGDLLQRLLGALDRHDHQTMASCYHPEATFRDIAFDLRGRQQIHSMWHMICGGDIRATFEILNASEHDGRVRLVDTYTFGAAPTSSTEPAGSGGGRRVRNVIDSRFRFSDGLIIEHRDACDARLWAAQALGGVRGFLAGRIPYLRQRKARQKLAAFVRGHPEYRE